MLTALLIISSLEVLEDPLFVDLINVSKQVPPKVFERFIELQASSYNAHHQMI